MSLPTGRARGWVRCPGPHDKPARRKLNDCLCTDCWRQLTDETRRRLRLSGGSGRRPPVERLEQLRDQLRDGVPLAQIEVSE